MVNSFARENSPVLLEEDKSLDSLPFWDSAGVSAAWKENHVKWMLKLDVDPQRDNDASPISTYRCMLRPTWMLVQALQHKSKYKSNSISNFFEKKILGSHVVVLVKTFPLMYQLIM